MTVKIKIFLLLMSLTSILNAEVLRSGSIMCNNASSIRKIVQLDRQGKPVKLLNYYDLMVSKGICSETVMDMNPYNLGGRDLAGGVTQIGILFVVTSDIGK